MRMWFKERAVYEKEVYSKKESSDEIKRKYVQRMMTHKKKTKELPPIKLKRYEVVGIDTTVPWYNFGQVC